MTGDPRCIHCGLPIDAHGTQDWCDSAVTGRPPGTTSFELALTAEELWREHRGM